MDKREFVQDTAQKILLTHLASRSISPDKFEQLAKDIAKMSSMLAYELEVSGNGWSPQAPLPDAPQPDVVRVQCRACHGVGHMIQPGGVLEECAECEGSGEDWITAPPRRS